MRESVVTALTRYHFTALSFCYKTKPRIKDLSSTDNAADGCITCLFKGTKMIKTEENFVAFLSTFTHFYLLRILATPFLRGAVYLPRSYKC